jgi:hypothetical protein
MSCQFNVLFQKYWYIICGAFCIYDDDEIYGPLMYEAQPDISSGI